jgi:hypothetical protein
MKQTFKSLFIFSIFAFTFLLGSCNKVKESKAVFIGSSKKTIFLSDYLKKELKLVVINESDSLIIGEVTKLYKTEEGWIILDQTKTKGFYMVDIKGSIRAYFNRVGQGPEDYIHIYDFDVDEENKEINMLCYPNKIIVTDYAFNIKQVYPLNETYQNIACFEHHIYLYGKNRTVFCYSPVTSQVTEVISEGQLNQVFAYTYTVFHKVGDNLLFIAHEGDKIYNLQNGKATLFLTFDFEQKESIYQFMRGKVGIEPDQISMYPPKVYAFFETPRKTLCMVYANPVYRLCEVSVKDNSLINDGTLISMLPDFLPSQPNRKQLTGTAMDLLESIFGAIKKRGMIVESATIPLLKDEEERLVITTYDLN